MAMAVKGAYASAVIRKKGPYSSVLLATQVETQLYWDLCHHSPLFINSHCYSSIHQLLCVSFIEATAKHISVKK